MSEDPNAGTGLDVKSELYLYVMQIQTETKKKPKLEKSTKWIQNHKTHRTIRGWETGGKHSWEKSELTRQVEAQQRLNNQELYNMIQ